MNSALITSLSAAELCFIRSSVKNLRLFFISTTIPIGTVVLITSLILGSTSAHAGQILDEVKSRNSLRCGVSDSASGFSEQNSKGIWEGFDVDFCRAVAAAVLGDAAKVKFVPLKSSNRFPALALKQIDLLVRSTTWTMDREILFNVQFPGVLFYDGQGFMVARSANIKSLSDLNSTTVCVEKGTTSEQRLVDYFTARDWKVTPLVIDSVSGVADAFFSGRCHAYTADISQLAAVRTRAQKGAEDFIILPEQIAKDPLGPVVSDSDREWVTIVRWVLIALIAAEEQGITRAMINTPATSNASETPNILSKKVSAKNLYFIGAQNPQALHALKIPQHWAQRAVGAVGNYGEIYERHFGKESSIPIERGLNRLWTDGGLHYALPFN